MMDPGLGHLSTKELKQAFHGSPPRLGAAAASLSALICLRPSKSANADFSNLPVTNRATWTLAREIISRW
jgi:hypothetical protein